MEIFSGKYKVLNSGSVFTFDEGSNIEMVIKPSATFSFRLILEFVENGGERDFVRSVDEKKGIIKIECINFGLGAGTVEPLEIGMAGGRKIYLHLWIECVSANRNVRKVEYTIFIER